MLKVINAEWRRKEVQDITPKKGVKTFFDYEWGQYEICDYVDCYHVFYRKKYLGRFKTLRMAKKAVAWNEGEKLPNPRKKIPPVWVKKRKKPKAKPLWQASKPGLRLVLKRKT